MKKIVLFLSLDEELMNQSKNITKHLNLDEAEIHLITFMIKMQCTSLLIKFYHRIILLYVFILAQASFFHVRFQTNGI